MAITATTVRRSADVLVLDITATADGDTVSALIPHGMGVVPDVAGAPILSFALAALPAWAVTTINAVGIIVTKLASVGSGNAAPQLRLRLSRPR